MVIEHEIKADLLYGNTNMILALLLCTPFTVLYPVEGESNTSLSLKKEQLRIALESLGEKMFSEGNFQQEDVQLWFHIINGRFFFLPTEFNQVSINLEIEDNSDVILFNPKIDDDMTRIILNMHGEYIAKVLERPTHVVSMYTNRDFSKFVEKKKEFLYFEQDRPFLQEGKNMLRATEIENPVSQRIIEILKVVGTMDVYTLLKRIVDSQIGVYVATEYSI